MYDSTSIIEKSQCKYTQTSMLPCTSQELDTKQLNQPQNA